jgi:septal ring factor EnvC (AmiA/AmiB activator)
VPVRGVGVPVLRFGGDDGFGGTATGALIQTRAGAQVVSPADGTVEFAGILPSYGGTLILDGGDGYLVTLSGLERVDVVPGQFVLAGEPLGVMGSRLLAAAVAPPQVSRATPALYVELRRGSQPLDPLPWWAGV